MAWVAVDKDETEKVFTHKPEREIALHSYWIAPTCKEFLFATKYENVSFIIIPEGSIEKLTGYKLTWEDNPIELKE